MEFKDYYQTLGVARDASQDDIKKAYRKLARRYHPDVSKEADAETRFKELGEAYEVLRDPEKRTAYDRFGSDWKAGQEFRPPPDWDRNFEFSGDGEGAFSDFFESLFGRAGQGPLGGGRRGPRHAARRGEDRHARVAIALEDAYTGARRTITLQTAATDARGRPTPRAKSLNVRIPAGITEGKRIRLAGQGGQGPAGAGDLYVEIAFEPHPLFTVDGKDVTLELPITPWEAALGARVAVPTLGGNVDLTVPPGSQAGQKMRLRGRGLPAGSGGGNAGDQYVVFKIVTPVPETAAQRALYEKMAAAMPMNPRERLAAAAR